MQISTTTEHWLSVCRNYVYAPGQHIKFAELGGDGNDAPFEQSFSNLAHSYLRDKAPTLLDHELGFQLLDRNQENTKAVGVFAFKVGSQQLFAPVFFLQGDLKGHELLYLKSQDMFVPLKENWLNYILNRKPNILGSGTGRQTQQLGVMQPDLNRLSQTPYKYAAANVIPSLHPFLPAYGHLATQAWGDCLNSFTDHCQERLDLGHFMKSASLPALEATVELMRKHPKIAAAFDEWHGIDTLYDAVKEARVRMDGKSVLDDPYSAVNRNQLDVVTGSVLKEASASNSPKAQQKIKIITLESSWIDGLPEDIDEEDAEKLMKDTVLIEDHRDGDEVSIPINLQVEERLSNPHETGVYQVLTKPGDFEKCLIICNPVGPTGRENMCTVIRMDAESRNWGNFPRSSIWVAGLDEELGGETDWQDFYDSLPDASSVSVGKNRYVAIGHRRNGTVPFRVEKEIGSSDGTKSYEVYFDTHRDSNGTFDFGRFDQAEHRNVRFDDYCKWRDGQRIHLDSKDGTDFRTNRGDVYIPQTYKILKVEKTIADEDDPFCCSSEVGVSKISPIQPGNILDAEQFIMRKTAELKVASCGDGYMINEGQQLSPVDTLITLVRDCNLREKAARFVMDQADAAHRRLGPAFRCRVKNASPFLTQGAPGAPAIPEQEFGGHNPMGFSGPTVHGQDLELAVPSMSSANTDPSIYNVNPANMEEPMDAAGVMQAAATGQKEVFDTAMIGSMLKAVRDDTMIDRYLPDLVKGVDRLGRILFMFYWHQDKFSERYGKQDLPELEDSLRNAFEMVGDVVLFLKQKTIEPYPEEDAQDLDLGSVANI